MNELGYRQEEDVIEMMGYELTARAAEAIEENNLDRKYALDKQEIAAVYGEEWEDTRDYDEDLDSSGELTENTLEATSSSVRGQVDNGMTSD